MPAHRFRPLPLLAVVLVPFVLAGCVPSGGGYRGSGYSSGGYDEPAPSLSTLDKSQRRALKQGCKDRYGDHSRKYRQCVDGVRHSEDALIDGCYKRYKGNDKKLRRCLDGL
ncbi:hypothetical protein [Azospirillum sp. ST 5-10]|uniref:hypothetical protein n=1 Tax=unclassified Azospirillum TaxID=2630922 RepID=UPI003F4A532D